MSNFNDLPPEAQDAILQGGALAVPEGVQPDYDPPNKNPMGIAVIVTCLIVAALCLATRTCSRVFIIRRVRTEDIIGFMAFGFYTGYVWVGFRMAQAIGFYVHQWNIRVITMSEALYAFYVLSTVYCFTLMLAKWAILLEWVHIFVPHGTRNVFWWICYTLITINILFYGSLIIAVQFYCVPREKIWKVWLPGECLERKTVDAPSAIFNLVFDVLILVLPQRVIWKLNMTTRKRLGVSIVFSFGLLACVSAAGRIHSTFTMNYQGDVSYSVSTLYLWGLSECTCVLMVLCIPAFPRLFASSPFLMSMLLSIKSWAGSLARPSGLSKGTSSTSSSRTWTNNKSWPRKAGKNAHSGLTTYERMEEGHSNTDVPLSTMNRPRNDQKTDHSPDIFLGETNPRHGENEIVRTTEWRTETHPVSIPLPVKLHPDQHPWTRNERAEGSWINFDE